MNRAAIALAVTLLAPAAHGQSATGDPPPPARCGLWAKFQVLIFEQAGQEHFFSGQVPLEAVTFYEGPFQGASAEDVARVRVQSIAHLGAWGTTDHDGGGREHYTYEYFPPEKMVRTMVHYGCR